MLQAADDLVLDVKQNVFLVERTQEELEDLTCLVLDVELYVVGLARGEDAFVETEDKQVVNVIQEDASVGFVSLLLLKRQLVVFQVLLLLVAHLESINLQLKLSVLPQALSAHKVEDEGHGLGSFHELLLADGFDAAMEVKHIDVP